MGFWETLEEEVEVEKAEAACGDVDDDTNIDPDVALSYIDEKIQNLLGHFQKDFEGGVFAQSLGAKYGGYGSFLPMYQRSPPNLPHPVASPIVQSQSSLRSSCNLPSEGSSQNSMVAYEGSVIQTSGATVANNTHGPHNLKSISSEDSERHDSSQIAEKAHESDGPAFTKSDNPPNKRKLTVRIKVVPDKGLHRNAAIYSGLGLTSPSSSLGNSPEEGSGAQLSSQENFNESTTSILKSLTACPVSSGSLNSPLHEDLFNLIRSRKESVDHKPAAILKERSGNIVWSYSNLESAVGVKGVLAGKKCKLVQSNENDLQARLENEVHSVVKKNPDGETRNSMLCLPHLHVGTDKSFGSVGTTPEVARQLEQHMPVKKRGLKDKVKERVSAYEFVKDEPLEIKDVQDTTKNQVSRSNSVESFGKCGLKGFKKECLFDQEEDATVKRNKISSSLSSMREDKIDNLEARNIKPNQPLKVASQTRDKSVKLTAKSSAPKELPSGGKNKLNCSEINGNSMLESDGTLRSEVYAAVKDRKSQSRDANKVHHNHKGLLGRKLEHMDDQDPGKHLFHVSGNKSGPVFSQDDTLTDNVPPSNGLMSRTEPAPGSSSVVITEDWVECVRCETWRLLPPGISSAQLPDKWTCSMQNWLPGKNRCDISEEETTQALRALYHASPVPETQNKLLPDANAPQFQPNVVTQHQMRLGKKFQSKDRSRTNNSRGPLLNSHLMTDHQEDVMKSITPKNMNQLSSEANLARKSNVKLSKKSVKVIGKCSDNLEENDHEKSRKKIKRERNSDNCDQGVPIKVETEGPFHINKLYSSENDHEISNKKLKRERNSDYDDQEVAKRVRIEGPMDMDNFYSSENKGKPGETQTSSSVSFPKKAAPKEKQKQLDKKEKVKLRISVKRRKDSLPDSVDGSSLDVKTHEATRLFPKTIKLEKSGDQFCDTEISVKENNSDNGFKNGKELKASESEVRGFSKTGAADKCNIRNTQTRNSGCTTNIVDKNTKKVQRFEAKLESGLTMEDITALKRDLGSEQFPTAAASSSSKIPYSGTCRYNYQEVKGSPVESVSSSPMRLSNLGILSPTRMCGLGKDDLKFGKFPAEHSRKSLSFIDDAFESNQSATFMKEIVFNPSFEIPVPEIQETDTKGKDTINLPVRADDHMVSSDTHTSKTSIASHVDVQGVTHHTSKIRMRNNPGPSQRHKSGVDPSAYLKANNKASGSNFERVVDRVSILSSDQEALQPEKSIRDETEIDQSTRASYHKLVENSDNPFSDESTIKALINNNVSKRNSGTRMEFETFGDTKCQSQSKFRECDQSEGRVGEGSVHRNSLPFHHGKSAAKIKRGGPSDIKSLNTSKGGEELGISESAPTSALGNSNHDSMKHTGPDQCGDQNVNGPSHSKGDSTIQGASTALAKAEEYRHFGDFSKESGFECNEAYFKAALMYLLGAALVESSNSESQKGEMSQIQIFDSSAKLSETCALEYEKRQEMAAAALAYKCMEVSYMRIVYFKSSRTRRIWHDLQTSLQMSSQSESPSSSASDIDNSNTQITNDKAVFCKGNDPAIGKHIIAPRDQQNLVRLLDFTKDVNSAMEAARKSQIAFAAAAKTMAEQTQNNNIITKVKEVIDFGFQDLEVFVPMVEHAIAAISRLVLVADEVRPTSNLCTYVDS